MRLMRKHDPQLMEDGFNAILPRAAEWLPQLIAEFEQERDHGLRCWLLELIGHSRSPEALPILAAHLDDPDESLRDWAVWGLRHADTRESRTVLWNAGILRG
jgi:HEAT repeat protein